MFSPHLCGLTITASLVMTATAADQTITYTLPKVGRVSLAVYDSKDRIVRTLRNAEPHPIQPSPMQNRLAS